MIRAATRFLILPLAVALPACGDATQRGESVPTVTVRENAPAPVRGDFTRIEDLDVLGDSIIVLDGELVRVFDHDGNDLGVLGGRGAGPGEYEMPIRVRVDSGIVSVVDLRLGRVTAYAGDKVVETRRLEPVDDTPVNDFIPLGGWGGLAETSVYMSSQSGSHQTRRLLLVHDDGRVDTLAAYRPGSVTFRDATSFGFLRAHAGNGGGWAVSRAGDRLVIVDGHAPVVRWWRIGASGLEGPTAVDLPVSAQELGEEDLEALIARENRAREEGGSPALSRTAEIDVPPYWGQVGRVVLSDDGEAWVQWDRPRTEADSLWFVVDLGSAEVRRVELPGGYELLTVAGDRLYGYRTDEYDVPTLSLLPRPE